MPTESMVRQARWVKFSLLVDAKSVMKEEMLSGRWCKQAGRHTNTEVKRT